MEVHEKRATNTGLPAKQARRIACTWVRVPDLGTSNQRKLIGMAITG